MTGHSTHIPSRNIFAQNGFFPPIRLLSAAQCAVTRSHIKFGELPDPLVWEKGRAATDRFLFDLAIQPGLLAVLRPLLGENFVLWGADILIREPGDVHPWHSDIESSSPDHRFVSVWIGIDHTSRESGLQLISRSHLFGKTFQEVAHEHGFRRGEVTQETITEWARQRDPAAEFVQPDLQDGDAIIFDGRLWHGSNNTRAHGCRIALLFQYAAAECPVLMPDLTQLEWPFRYKETRVPVIIVSGKTDSSVNHVVPLPVATQKLATEIKTITFPVAENPAAPWQPHQLFAGSTPNLHHMNSHWSELSAGHTPHTPHAHREEEILVVLDGEAELLIAETDSPENIRVMPLRSGSFVYYPAYQWHTIRNPTDSRISYLMFKWTGAPIATAMERILKTTIIDLDGVRPESETGFNARLLFENSTNYLSKLHAHLTVLQPGAGYEPHADKHDVAIVILQGEVETLGRIAGPGAVVFYAADQLHGMKNAGSQPARYLVFEFHARTDSGV